MANDLLRALVGAAMNGGNFTAPAEDEGVKKNNGNDKNGGNTKDAVSGSGLSGLSRQIKNKTALAEELGIGEITLTDIIKELEKPGRDPRDELPKPIMRSGDIMELKDLSAGMELVGTVRNVIDFGAFVDIGVHEDGLVHISQICNRFIKHPLEAVKVGEIVKVRVLDVDVKRKRISLTMRLDEKK